VFLPKIVPLSPEGEDHYPNSLHKHNQLTFSYPTVGIPEPGKRYNNTPVERSDLVLFDELLNEMLKPYNVEIGLSRTPIAGCNVLGETSMGDTLSAATF
jgi:hypothetical protein